MIGRPLAVLLGMVKTTTLEELLGPQDDEIPDFSGMVANREAGGEDGLTFADQSDRLSVRQNLRPFVKTIEKIDFEPLLLEIAVIHDPRLVEEKRKSRSARPIQTFFVSDVVSFLDSPQHNHLLKAWDLAIQSLLNKELHKSPVPIVTNQDTYKQALYHVDLSSIVRKAHSRGPDGRRSIENPAWPELSAEEDSVNPEDATESTQPSAGRSCDAARPHEHPLEFRRPYDFTWSADHYKPEESIRFLSRRLVYHLASACNETNFSNGEVHEKCRMIENALAQAELLVIPFKRPRAMGLIAPQKNNAEPGGCIFAIIRRKTSRPGPPKKISEEEIRDLSMRLTWLLAHSALAEAYSELAMKQDRDHFASVTVHHVPTELRTLEHHLYKSRDELRRNSSSSPAAAEAWEHSNQAIEIAKRLETTAELFNKAQKSRDTGVPQYMFSRFNGASQFVGTLSTLLDEAWIQALEPFREAGERKNVVLDKSLVSLDALSISKAQIVAGDETRVRFVVLELLKNALRHGDFSQSPVVTARLLPVAGSANRFVVLEVTNPILHGVSGVSDTRSPRQWKIGLTSLSAFTEAFGLPEPINRPEHGRFVAQITVGEIRFL